jgi:hypothetical protein
MGIESVSHTPKVLQGQGVATTARFNRSQKESGYQTRQIPSIQCVL